MLESGDEVFHFLGFIFVEDEERIICLHDDEIVDADERHEFFFRGMYEIILALEREDIPLENRIGMTFLLEEIEEPVETSDVAPLER